MSLSLPSRLLGLAILGIGLGALRCSSDTDQHAGSEAGTGGVPVETPRDKLKLDLGGEETSGGTEADLHPLCRSGKAMACIPDDPDSCPRPSFGSAGASGDDSGVGQGGMGGAAGAPGAGDGGSGADLVLGCHLVHDDGELVRSCEPAGTGELDGPCLSPANCAPGYTCVGEGKSGLCRPYCCLGDAESCGSGTYCAPRPVVGSSPGLEAPVCVRADQCKLLSEEQCAEGTACAPVRADGTTSCVVPGTAEKGDVCAGPFSCARGLVCSLSRGCLELCSTVSTSAQCDEGEFCQALAGFPEDVGVCIALTGTR